VVHPVPQRWAPLINAFNRTTLFFYINYHRPCFFQKIIVDSRGKDKKIYPYKSMMTSYDKLKSIKNAKDYLKSNITFDILNAVALSKTDDQAAEQLQKEHSKLFKTMNENETKKAAKYKDSFSLSSDSFFYWNILHCSPTRCGWQSAAR